MDKRFKFHITPYKGWMNDPNGLVFYKGLYHIFFQHYPYDVNWGPMHWGHVTSKDLIHFQYAPIALYPDMESGCFSGTSLVEDDTLYLVYTSFIEKDGVIRQIQSLAYSHDGITFKKHGVIIDENNLPSCYSIADFRDPKILKKNDKYYLLVAAKIINGNGRIIMFESCDLHNWTFISDIFDKDSKGTMIECPDYVDDMGLLIYCEQNQQNEDKYHLNIHTNRYCLGHFDMNNKFISEYEDIIDYGFDFYAPQTFANKHILLAWLSMWDREMHTKQYGYAGMLTIPRYIEVRDNRLYQTPIFDKENEEVIKIKNHYETNIQTGVIEVDFNDVNSFDIEVKKGNDEVSRISTKDGYIIFNRSKTNQPIVGAEKDEYSLKGERYMPFLTKNKNKMYIVIDTFSIEFFFNGLSLSSLVYNDINSSGFSLTYNGGEAVVHKYLIETHHMKN